MQTFKYSDLLHRLQDFDHWLRRLGLTPRNDDRIHRAFQTLRMVDEATQKGRQTGQYLKIEGQHLFPVIEALEAHEILCAFGKETSQVLANALKRALSGPEQPANEKSESSRDGRNVWFELALAADWKLRGARVHLAEPDLQLARGDNKFLIACKRPAGENSVRSNIRGAISQLNESLKSAPQDAFGVVAISLSRVLNPGDKYWSRDVEQLGDLLHQKMVSYTRHWQSAEADPRICSILFHAATPSNYGPGVDLSRMTFGVAGPLQHDSAGTQVFGEHILEMKSWPGDSDGSS